MPKSNRNRRPVIEYPPPPAPARTVMFTLRVTEAERASYDRAAEKAGQDNASAWARAVLNSLAKAPA